MIELMTRVTVAGLIAVVGWGMSIHVLAQATGPIERLAWLAGSWQGVSGTTAIEEHWTAPRGGTMVGMHRDVEGGKTSGFEYARIVADTNALVYYASPGGRPPTPFTAIEVGASRVVFENRAHDFPQRVIYWREGTTLHARIEGEQNGKALFEEWAWTPGSLTR